MRALQPRRRLPPSSAIRCPPRAAAQQGGDDGRARAARRFNFRSVGASAGSRAARGGFMRGVHERLREHAGQSDPLAKIAQEWRSRLRVLVLDEFFVTDIGDAMLLSRLLERLFAEGVTLVTTSNTAPQNLYLNGLQRESFLPAIGLLQTYCVELYAEAPRAGSPVYRAPLAEDAERASRPR
ncbi:AFG1/ZapE family ATPase [Pantoea ananatis]|nr:AFG1/ZapE family ATPase [Pantoea ananatis]